MSLVAVSWPATESETVVIVSLLDAMGIPHFVHGGGLAALLPGIQIGAYNTRTVMVPASRAEDAHAALAVLSEAPHADQDPDQADTDLPHKLRMAAEALFFGWFVPPREPPAIQGEET